MNAKKWILKVFAFVAVLAITRLLDRVLEAIRRAITRIMEALT